MFPVMLRVRGRRCLVVGGGGVALRKVHALVAEEAEVTVVAPEALPALEQLAQDGQVTRLRRSYREGEASGYLLVFAATDSREVNRKVYDDATGAGVWANTADDPELCSFHLPARVQRESLQLAIASRGEAPFAVRRLRQTLERRFGPEWGEWVAAAARFRDRVREADLDFVAQEHCFDRFFAATVDGERMTARVPTRAEEDGWLVTPVEGGEAEPPRRHREIEETLSDEEAQDDRQPQDARQAGDVRPGLVSLVGAGPGCGGLLTVRGRQRLLAADTVVYDRLAASALPCDLPARVELHCVGKTAGSHPVPQEEITAQLVRLSRQGKRVVRLKGGDPYVFGRGSEEAEILRDEGVPFEVVPGVTSGVAAPGWMGIPVTHRREAVKLTLLTAHEAVKRDGPQVRWDLLAQDKNSTLVGYMGVTTLPKVVELLLGGGMDAKTPAALVERGTLAAQRSVVSTLAKLPQAAKDAGIKPPALFVIGPTVRHAKRLDWFSRQPLAGERLVVPAEAADLGQALEAAGAEVVAVPTPVSPAARVVLGAARITGCLLRSPADVEALEDEREGPGWEEHPVAWCLDSAAAERALRRGWQRVEEILEAGETDVVERISAHRNTPA